MRTLSTPMRTAAGSPRRTRTAYGLAAVICILAVAAFVYLPPTLIHNPNASNSSTSTSSTGSSVASSSSSSGQTSSSSSVTSTTTGTSTSTSQNGPGDWTTYHGSNSRDGYDTTLPKATSPAVAWHVPVDGRVYAEPLSFNGSVFVATENNTVYSIKDTGMVVWSTNLGAPINGTSAPYQCGGHPDILPTIGVTGTPVIDPKSGTLYLAALTNASGYQLVALSTTTGKVLWNQTVAPSGFSYIAEEQRAALTLANGLVYIPFGGFSWDCGVPYGWIVAYSANGNGTEYNYKVPAGGQADIWAPEGLSVDSSGFVYAVTADSGATSPPFDYGNAVLKLSPHLSLVDYFGDQNYTFLNSHDLDLGSTGPTLLPGGLVFSIGKQGMGYLLDSTNLGGVGGQLYGASVCSTGGWGGTAYADGVVYVPCANGLMALSIHSGAKPSFSQLWNQTGFFAGPPIVAGGAVWTFDIYNGTLFALDPLTGSVDARVSVLPINSLAHFSTPSVGAGMIFFAGNGTVFALKTGG